MNSKGLLLQQVQKLCSKKSLEPCDKRKCVELIKKWLKEEVSNEWKTMITDD